MGGMGEGNALSRAVAAERTVVVFDFDGTLADTMGGIVEVASGVLRDFGLDEECLADCPKLVGPPFPEAFSEVFGLSLADAQLVTDRFRERYNGRGLVNWPNFPGIPELVRELSRAGRTVAVASSKREETLRVALRQEGIHDLFDRVRGKRRELGHDKADTLRELIGELGVAPDDVVMVGDRFYDVDAALACGLPCVGVTYGGTAPAGELERAGACSVAESVEELSRVLLG